MGAAPGGRIASRGLAEESHNVLGSCAQAWPGVAEQLVESVASFIDESASGAE